MEYVWLKTDAMLKDQMIIPSSLFLSLYLWVHFSGRAGSGRCAHMCACVIRQMCVLSIIFSLHEHVRDSIQYTIENHNIPTCRRICALRERQMGIAASTTGWDQKTQVWPLAETRLLALALWLRPSVLVPTIGRDQTPWSRSLAETEGLRPGLWPRPGPSNLVVG